MTNVLFNRSTDKVVGRNRPARPFEYQMELPYEVSLRKTVQETDGEKQKTDAQGNLLYKMNVQTDGQGEETYDETTEARIATDFEEKEVTYTVTDEEGNKNEITKTIKNPVEWEDLEPVMVDSVVTIQKDFGSEPTAFTYEEVVGAKEKYLNINRLRNVIYFDESLSPENLSTDLQSFKGDLGKGFVSVQAEGEVRTEKISLGNSYSNIEIYAEVDEGIVVEVGTDATTYYELENGVVRLDAPVDSIYIRFSNPNNSRRDIHAYGVLV